MLPDVLDRGNQRAAEQRTGDRMTPDTDLPTGLLTGDLLATDLLATALLDRIATALERLAPPPAPAIDWRAAPAYVWDRGGARAVDRLSAPVTCARLAGSPARESTVRTSSTLLIGPGPASPNTCSPPVAPPHGPDRSASRREPPRHSAWARAARP